jgi:hypothetical protein
VVALPNDNTNIWIVGGGIIALIILIIVLSTKGKVKQNSLTAFGRQLNKISGRR